MAKLFNRVKMTVSGTPGVGDVTLGSASTNYQTFAAAGTAVGDQVEVVFEDGEDWEISQVAYGAGSSLTGRALIESSTGSILALTSAAVVFVDASRRNIVNRGRVAAHAANQAMS